MADILSFLNVNYPSVLIFVLGGFVVYLGFKYHNSQVKPSKDKANELEKLVGNLPCNIHDVKMEEFTNDMVEIKTSIIYMQKTLDLLNNSNRGGGIILTKNNSPLSITKEGYDVIANLGIYGMLEDNWLNIKYLIEENTKSQNPYDIQQFCIEQAVVFPEKFLREEYLDKVKKEAYQQGVPLIEYMKLIAVIVRDRFFEEHGIDVGDVDKHDPNNADSD